MAKERVRFKVSSALKNLIGQELITNSHVAVFELVKNSFDAGAKNIDVIFDIKNRKITITDDGSGMSKDDVINKWLFIGYSEKKNKSGLYSGNKGIGRFSCDRLGSQLYLSTYHDGTETIIEINWDDFEEKQSDEIQSVSFDLSSSLSSKSNGTSIIISGLRDNWDLPMIEQTKKQLIRLVSPNKNDVKQNLSMSIIDSLGIINGPEIVFNDVFDYMMDKTIFVKATFDDSKIIAELYDHGRRIVKNISQNMSLIKSATMQVFFGDRNAKTIFKKKTGVEMVNYGNLFVYRNKFRVFPYGETSFDIFGLAQRKTQGYNRYLGPREIVGWIDLFDSENHFVESTSRDRGFIENIYYANLKELYFEYLHRPLEKYVQLINYGNVLLDDLILTINENAITEELSNLFKTKNSESTFVDTSTIKNLSNENLSQNLNEVDNLSSKDRRKIIEDAKKRIIAQEKEIIEEKSKQKNIQEENKALRKEIELKNKYFEIENPSRQKILEHDLGLVTKKLSFSLDKMVKENKIISNRLFDKELKNVAWALFRVQGIRNFALKTKMDTISKTTIDVGSFFSEYSNNLVDDNYLITLKIEEEFQLFINVFDLITIFDNIFANAKVLKATEITIFVKKNCIEFFTDTYSEKKNIDFSRVFDFGYSTTGGTGMGMYIIKQICEENKLQITMNRFEQTNLVVTRIEK